MGAEVAKVLEVKVEGVAEVVVRGAEVVLGIGVEAEWRKL